MMFWDSFHRPIRKFDQIIRDLIFFFGRGVAALHMSMTCGTSQAYKVQLNVVIYGAALSVCEQSGQWAMAMHLFNDMCRKEPELRSLR